MKNYVQDGHYIDYTPGTAVTSGSMVLVGTRVGVAPSDIPAATPGTLRVTGVFTVTKLTSDNVAQGAALYWDNTNKRLTTTSAGNTYAGWAHAAAGTSATTVNIKIND